MKTKLFIVLLIFGNMAAAMAQHEHGGRKGNRISNGTAMRDTMRKNHEHARHQRDSLRSMRRGEHRMQVEDTARMKHMTHMEGHRDMHHEGMPGMEGGQMKMDVPMGHSYSLNLPMSRNGSGTSWLPDESPIYGYMLHSKKWMYMIHGQVFARYTKQDLSDKGSRGDEKFDAPNWFMLMGQRKVGNKGLFHFSTMVSLDRITEGGGGYPLLFQSGESWQGKALIDHQHPHDLFSELAVAYTQSLSKKSDLTLYLGYPGEPAIGPPAFMHRPSAFADPDAPISHHWSDATHITFGVATLGYRYDKLKLEVSSFTGREPDENRYDFDKPRFDSWSARLSFNPAPRWSLQMSHAWLNSPEQLHQSENITRSTASVIYARKLRSHRWVNVSAVWGMNKIKGLKPEDSALLEGSFRFNRFVAYGRYEWVEKTGEELVLDENKFAPESIFPVNALTLGINYDLWDKGARLAIGAQATAYQADSRLDELYGKNPFAAEVFLRLYPKIMNMRK